MRFSGHTGGFLTHPFFEWGVEDGSAVVEGGFGVRDGTGRHCKMTRDWNEVI